MGIPFLFKTKSIFQIVRNRESNVLRIKISLC